MQQLKERRRPFEGLRRRGETISPPKKSALALGVYTLGFFIIMGAFLLPFVQNGKFLIHGSDGYDQHFLVFEYLRSYYRQVFGQLLRGNLNLPLYDFSIGFGDDILTTLNYYGLGDPLYLLSLLVPLRFLPHIFTACYVIRFYLGGAFFFGFCRQLGHERLAGVAGGWLYAFSSYIFYVGMGQSVFLHCIPLLPLLLWGAVRCVQQKSPLLLALATFVSGLCGFYFFVLSSFALPVVVLSVSLSQQAEKNGGLKGTHWLRTTLQDILRCILPYLAGLLMSMALLLPQLVGFLDSNRNRKQFDPLFCGLDKLTDYYYNFLQPNSVLGMAAPALLGMLLLLACRKRLAGKLALSAAWLPAISPIVSCAMVGFTRHGSDNWWYITTFTVSYALTAVFADLGRLTRAQKLTAAVGSGLYLWLLWRRTGFGSTLQIAIGLSLLACTLVLLAFSERSRFPLLRSRRLCAGLLCILLVCGDAVVLNLWARTQHGPYRNARFAAQSAPVTGDQLYEPQLYRVDTSDIALNRWWAGSNAPIHGGYNGISAYFSLQNSKTLRAIDEWGLVANRRRSFFYRGVDLSVGLETLSSVKYLFLRPGEEEYLPYGFAYTGDTPQSNQFTFMPENGPILLRYENLYQLPFGYTYDSWINGADYLALDGFEKQVVMLHSLVLEEPPALAGGEAAAPQLAGLQRVNCEVVGLVNCETVPEEGAGAYRCAPDTLWTADGGPLPENAPECPASGGLVLLRMTAPANSELHFCMPDLFQENGYYRWCGVHLSGRDKRFWVTDPNDIIGEDVGHEGWINLGYFEEEQDLLVGVSFEAAGTIHFGQIYAAAWDMADYAFAAAARGETVLQNVVVDTNSVAGLLQTETDTLLCLSIPYSVGWHATIDGVRCEPQRANSMFMALEIPAGEHVIGLYYITPGLKYGLVLSALGAMLLALLLALYWRANDIRPFARLRVWAGAAWRRLGSLLKALGTGLANLARRMRALLVPRRGLLLALGAYTLGFAAVALAHAWPYLADGRYFIYGADAYTQHFPAFCYALDYWKQFLGGLLRGRLMPQLYSFSLGLGGDILTTLHYYGLATPFCLLALGTPAEKLPLAFGLITLLQLYLGGIGFYAFCRKLSGPADLRTGAVVGAWLYVLTGFYPLAVEHPIMAHAVFYLPLLLLGCEKILRRESPLLLILGVFGMALTGFYFLFICSVALAFYVLLRVWALGQRPWWRAAFTGAVRSLAAYLTGLCMAGAVFLPAVLGYLDSTRTGSGAAFSLRLLFSGFGELRGWMLGLADTASFWYVGAFGLLAVVLCLSAPRGQRSWPLITGFGIAAVFIVSPLAQNALVGFGETADTRFWFALQFLAAFAAVRCWPRLASLTRPQLLALAGAVGLYALFCLGGGGTAQWVWLGFAFAAALLAAGIVIFKERTAKKLCSLLLAALVLLQPALALHADGARRAPSYRNGRFARQMPAITAATLPEGEYRVDTGDVGLHRWWASANAPLVGGYKGLSEYFSILNQHYANAMLHDWALAPAQQGNFSFQGLDGCMALNTLASVRYTFVRPGEEAYVPYGYAYVGETPQAPGFTFQPDNGPTLLRYENLYALPLGYACTAALTPEQYTGLNGLEKQAAMMCAVALADGAVPEGFAAIPQTAGVSVLSHTLEGEDAAWREGILTAAADGSESSFVLHFALDKPGEVHLRLTGLAVQDISMASLLYFALDGGLAREVYPFALDEEECWVNLGQAAAGEHTASVTLEPGGRFALEGLEVWSYSLAAYEAAAAALGKTVLQNVVVDTNSVAGLLQTDTDTLLCLSIPYSAGWHATIDGVRCEPRRANSMFMALEVPAGEHVIGLYYITPGLKYGLLLSALGLAGLAAQLLWYYRGRLPALVKARRRRVRA